MNIFKQVTGLLQNKEERDVFIEYSHSVMDEARNLDHYDNIPIVGHLTKAGKFALAVRDRIFVERLGQILERLGELDESAVKEFSQSLEDDGTKEEFAEHLVTLVEQTESKYKARIIATLLKHMIEGQITKDNFDFLCFTVTRTYLHTLYSLYHQGDNQHALEKNLGPSLAALRLIDVSVKAVLKTDTFGRPIKESESGIPEIKQYYTINHQGRLLSNAIEEVIPEDSRKPGWQRRQINR